MAAWIFLLIINENMSDSERYGRACLSFGSKILHLEALFLLFTMQIYIQRQAKIMEYQPLKNVYLVIFK